MPLYLVTFSKEPAAGSSALLRLERLASGIGSPLSKMEILPGSHTVLNDDSRNHDASMPARFRPHRVSSRPHLIEQIVAREIRAGLPERTDRRTTRFHLYASERRTVNSHNAFDARDSLWGGNQHFREHDQENMPAFASSHKNLDTALETLQAPNQ